MINNLNENLLNRNYSLTWFEEKYIDLLEMSPREDSFQDLIVYPLIDSILANKIHVKSKCSKKLQMYKISLDK